MLSNRVTVVASGELIAGYLRVCQPVTVLGFNLLLDTSDSEDS